VPDTKKRNFAADTFAVVVFFTITGIISGRYIACLEWDEVSLSRIIGRPLMVLTARPDGLWLEMVRQWFEAKGPGSEPMSIGG